MSLVDISGARAQRVAPIGDAGFALAVQQMLADGAGFAADPARGNHEFTLLASAARTATINSDTQVNVNARGALVIVNITAFGSGTGIRPIFQAMDPVSGNFATMWTNGYLTATGTYAYVLYPGAADLGGLTGRLANTLPRRWRVQMGHGDSNAHTYSVAWCYIV